MSAGSAAPRSTTRTSPACTQPAPVWSPGFDAAKVHVRCARTARPPGTAPVSASSPEGMSSATTSGGTTARQASTQRAATPDRAPTDPEADQDKPDAKETESGMLQIKNDTPIHRLVDGKPVPTSLLVRAPQVVRKAKPPNGKTAPGFCYVSTAAEVFGWIKADDTAPVSSDVASLGDADISEGKATGDQPELGADEYDDLLILQWETAVYPTQSATGTPVIAKRMDTMVDLHEKQTVDKVEWNKVRLVRQPPFTGWVKALDGVKASATAQGGLSGDPPLQLGSTGPSVRMLEEALAQLGLLPAGAADETFDQATHDALVLFQQQHGLDADGVFGPMSAAALIKARGGDGAATAMTGTWKSGYALTQATGGRCLTPDGKPSGAGYGSARPAYGDVWNMPIGPCEVLLQGGAEASVVDPSDGVQCWYVRAAKGGSTNPDGTKNKRSDYSLNVPEVFGSNPGGIIPTVAITGLTSIGSAQLYSIEYNNFTFSDNMSGGRGYIALAVVIIARWSPLRALWAALIFGICEALALRVQVTDINVPAELMLALPYVVTLIVYAGVIGKSRPPKALGREYSRG